MAQWQKIGFSGLVLLQYHWVEGGYLKDVKSRLKLKKAGFEYDFLHVRSMHAQLDGNVTFIQRNSWQWLAPWLTEEGVDVLGTSCLEHLWSQKLTFVDLVFECLILSIQCIASLWSVQGSSWENLTCCPALLASKALCWGLGPSNPFSSRICTAQKATCYWNQTVLKRSSTCWKFKIIFVRNVTIIHC